MRCEMEVVESGSSPHELSGSRSSLLPCSQSPQRSKRVKVWTAYIMLSERHLKWKLQVQPCQAVSARLLTSRHQSLAKISGKACAPHPLRQSSADTCILSASRIVFPLIAYHDKCPSSTSTTSTVPSPTYVHSIQQPTGSATLPRPNTSRLSTATNHPPRRAGLYHDNPNLT